MPKKKPAGPTPVEFTQHKDTRKNIPTQELRGFVQRDDEEQPKELLYPRDPTLDPQLVWRGKDDLDRNDLSVPVVPVYIQEKIHPAALVENLRKTAKAGELEPELTFFDDFNGLDGDFKKKTDFYHWDQHWSNRMILGDSLVVMTSLAEKEGLRGKVQMIYLDPPYGIKFGSNWQVSTRKRDVKDGKIEDATREPEQIRAFRDTWQLGIHSYLSYLRDRFTAARELLTESGSIFVQIGDENVHLVRSIMDEVFGSENFISIIGVRKTAGATAVFLPGITDFIVWYAKNTAATKYRSLFREKALGDEGAGNYSWLELADGTRRKVEKEEFADPNIIPTGARVFAYDNLTSQSAGRAKGEGAASWFPVEFDGRTFRPSMQVRWKTNEAGMSALKAAKRLGVTGSTLWYVRYLHDFPAFPLANAWDDTASSFSADKVYVVQTIPKVIERCLLMATDPGDLVLDPTCGSGTTAYVAEQWGRRWITVDTSRVALALARTRLMTARYPYYLLADSKEGIRKEAEVSGRFPPDHKTMNDVRKGFVYKRVPHVTLKSIANNPDIKDGMSREEIDDAIAKHADTEVLYDKPYDDAKRIRVAGPFTVESLSPHRVLSDDVPRTETERAGERSSAEGQFVTMIIANLKKAGVQNTKKSERLVFDRLEPHAGRFIHAIGTYVEGGDAGAAAGPSGRVKRVAVHIGPEHGTVGPQQIRDSAKEAAEGVGYDTLIVCGFAFDPHVGEDAGKYGSLVVLPTKMNPDLAMGDELLKKTGAGNLFMVFGEPDIEVNAQDANGEKTMTVEIRGLDVYDPTTGAIRNSKGTDDIACWFIDTDYDGESFFVRHAYFTGADEPYEKLKRALRANINEDAWASLYATKSRPFPPPESGRIAVKVINHYGDEVLKVYDI
jgi:adenine-specific DNA-methyltransferase